MGGDWSLIAPWFFGLQYTVAMAPAWSFVPVTSALDIQNPASQNEQYSFPINGQNGSTATRYIAQETTASFSNVNHTNFTARNARWLFNEMEDLNQPLTCNDFCGNPEITGPGNVCTSGDFSLNYPGTVTWSISPSGIASLSCSNCPVTTLNVSGAGTVILTATVNYTCDGTAHTITQSRIIRVGMPVIGSGSPIKIYSGSPSDFNEICSGAQYRTNMSISNATSYNWQRIAATPSNTNWSPMGQDISFYFWAPSQTAVFRLSASNSCGSVSQDYAFRAISCSGGGGGCLRYEVSPNPAHSSNEVFVKIPQIPPPCFTSETTTVNSKGPAFEKWFTGINVYDQGGNLKIARVYKTQKQASVRGLKPGIYIFEIVNGKYSERHQVLIL